MSLKIMTQVSISLFMFEAGFPVFANNWESNKGQPAETINTKVQWESKLNLPYVKPISDPFS